jgi:hypothetical protein
MSATSDSLGVLLKNSWEFYRKHWRPVLFGAVVFGIIFAILNEWHQSYIAPFRGQVDYMKEMNISGAEALVALQGANIGAVVPQMIAVMTLSILLALLVYTYFLLLTLGKGKTVESVLRQMPGAFLPIVGASFWVFLRSFAWIPFIGFIFAIILGPRFVCAPIILLQEKKGVIESVRLSYQRTRGYWMKIVGNLLAISLCAVVAIFVLAIPVAIVTLGISTLSTFVSGILGQLVSGFIVVFTVFLAQTIMKVPKEG